MRSVSFFVCLIIGFLLLHNSQAYTQDSDEELKGLLERVILLSAAMHSQGYTVVHIEVDKLQKGQNYSTSRKLFKDNHYKIVGFGGVGISDLDIKLYDENDNLIDEDTSNDNVPEVDVSPRWSGKFYIRTSVFSLENGYSTSNEYFFLYIIGFKHK